jgi:hypothetical protein
VFCNFRIEADFLVPLELHYSAVMYHQLDGPIADGSECLPELLEQGLGQRQRVVWPGMRAHREGRELAHDPI